jgi:hypothetical protein
MELKSNGLIKVSKGFVANEEHDSNEVLILRFPLKLNVFQEQSKFLKRCLHVSTKLNSKNKIDGLQKTTSLYQVSTSKYEREDEQSGMLTKTKTRRKIDNETPLEINDQTEDIDIEVEIESENCDFIDKMDPDSTLVTTIALEFGGNKSLFRKIHFRKSECGSGTLDIVKVTPRARNKTVFIALVLFLTALAFLYIWNARNEVSSGPVWMSKVSIAYAIGFLIAFSGLSSWSNIKGLFSSGSRVRKIFRSPELAVGQSTADMLRSKSLLASIIFLLFGAFALFRYSSPVELPALLNAGKIEESKTRYYSFLRRTENGPELIKEGDNIRLYAWDLPNICLGLSHIQYNENDAAKSRFCVGDLNLDRDKYTNLVTGISYAKTENDFPLPVTFRKFVLERGKSFTFEYDELRGQDDPLIIQLASASFDDRDLYAKYELSNIEEAEGPLRKIKRIGEAYSPDQALKNYVLNYRSSKKGALVLENFNIMTQNPYETLLTTTKDVKSYSQIISDNWGEQLTNAVSYVQLGHECSKRTLRHENNKNNFYKSLDHAWISFIALQEHPEREKIARSLVEQLTQCIYKIRVSDNSLVKEDRYLNLVYKAIHLILALELKVNDGQYVDGYRKELIDMLGGKYEIDRNAGWQPKIALAFIAIARAMKLTTKERFTTSGVIQHLIGLDDTLANLDSFRCQIKELTDDPSMGAPEREVYTNNFQNSLTETSMCKS